MCIKGTNFFSEYDSSSWQIDNDPYKNCSSMHIPLDQADLKASEKRCEILDRKLAKAENEVKQLQERIVHCRSGKTGRAKARSLKRLWELSQSRCQQLTHRVTYEKTCYEKAKKTEENPVRAEQNSFSEASLSPKYMLEKFIENVENPHSSWTTNTPVSEWYGIKCNEKGEVLSICTKYRKLNGMLNWRFLPRSVIEVNVMYSESLGGEIVFSALPPNLKKLSIIGNKFTGNLDMSKLPRTLRILCLSNNNFGGFFNSKDCLQMKLKLLDFYNNPNLKGIIKKSELLKLYHLIPSCKNTQIEVVSEEVYTDHG